MCTATRPKIDRSTFLGPKLTPKPQPVILVGGNPATAGQKTILGG